MKAKPSSQHLEPTRGVLRGTWAEVMATEYLEKAGLTILERNYRVRGGEIDIIALDAMQTTVFVEVKQRTSSSHGSAGEYINARKAGLIRRAALIYLERDDVSCRFDAILIAGSSVEDASLEWLQDAF